MSISLQSDNLNSQLVAPRIPLVERLVRQIVQGNVSGRNEKYG